MKNKAGVLIAIFVILIFSVSVVAASNSGTTWNVVDYENVQLTLLNQNPDPAEPGEFVELRFNVVNTGSIVSDAKFEIVEEFPFTVVSDELLEITEFKGGGDNSYVLYYKIKVDEDAVEGDNDIRIRFALSDGRWVTAGPFTVRVKTHDAVLSVEDISLEPEKLLPGKEGELKFELKNWADSLLKDIHLKLELGGTHFSPVGSTNERTISSLNSGESIFLTYKLFVDGEASANMYQVPIMLTYSDETGIVYSKNVTIGVFVDGEPEYFMNLEDSDVYETGKAGKVVVSLSNIGPSEMKFLTMELKESDDYEVISNNKEYLGNLESDDFETAEFEIHINNVKKEILLNLELIYKDSYNTEFVKDEYLSLNIYSSRDAVKFGFAKGVSFLPSILLFVGVAVLIFLFGFWIYMLIDIFKHPLRNPDKQLLWIFLMVVLLFVGAFLYYVFARRRRK
ncbi:MAG: PLDc N-terminal domain-containing protein [Nanoarchaeota archaeon]|nr:PLDc N-terminal domain-containing protein [Nanoarchaeota archaeon]